jgi:hypothetical protein
VKLLEVSGKRLQQVAAEPKVHASEFRTPRNERLAAGSTAPFGWQEVEAAELAWLHHG